MNTVRSRSSFGNADSLAADDQGDKWRFDFHWWIWRLGVERDVNIGPMTSDVIATYLDTSEASDSLFALSRRVEIGRSYEVVFLINTMQELTSRDHHP